MKKSAARTHKSSKQTKMPLSANEFYPENLSERECSDAGLPSTYPNNECMARTDEGTKPKNKKKPNIPHTSACISQMCCMKQVAYYRICSALIFSVNRFTSCQAQKTCIRSGNPNISVEFTRSRLGIFPTSNFNQKNR